MIIDKIENVLRKAEKKTKTLQFEMSLPTDGISYSYSSTIPNQRIHSASVGKLMTAALIFIAIDEGHLKMETRVSDILEPGLLDKLFLVNGIDYQKEITIKHLLGHISGINDYFESKTFDGSLFTDEVISHTDIFWKPLDLLEYTRNRQKAVAKPGERFFYSDTGYILLGLIIEKIFNIPFYQALHKYIFEPSDMNETHLCFYSKGFEQKLLAPLYINGVDVHLFQSLSCDFSGGGLSTTTSDLIKFLDNLQNGKLFDQMLLNQMANFEHRFLRGIYYGYGMMQLRFEDFFFMLGNLPRLQGHIGITGAHAWYDPETRASFVLNVGDVKDMALSFRILIKIMQLVQKSYKT